jgi:hypothetical protein
MTRGETDRPSYEPPELRVLGTLHELTLGRSLCRLDNTLGLDLFGQLKLTNCSG